MIKKITLTNFKSFKNIVFDFSSSKKRPLNYAVVYGENGSGKTNLVESISFLKESISTMKMSKLYDNILNTRLRNDDYDSNVVPLPDITDLCSMARTIGAKEPMKVQYEMLVGSTEIEYSMIFDGDSLIEEELRTELNRNMGTLFRLSKDDGKIKRVFWESLFKNDSFKKDVDEKIERFWGKHSFLSIINSEKSTNNSEYMKKAVGKLNAIIELIDNICVNRAFAPSLVEKRYHFLNNLEFGMVEEKEMDALNVYGRALNKFFRRIYHSVTDVHYEYETDPTGHKVRYRLIFTRKIDGAEIPVPSTHESAGTRKLVKLFNTLLECASGKTAFIDEIDKGVHDKLIFDVLSQILLDIKGQLVFTTHNTSLLKIIKSKNAFVIDVDSDGYKAFRSFNERTRTMAHNNNQIRYMRDEFGGVPYISEVDLEGISVFIDSELSKI